MSADQPPDDPIIEWRRRHQIAEDDPILAVADLIGIHVRQATSPDDEHTPPPSFEEFRSTIELLDRRSKSFIQQSADTVAELRRFTQSLNRLNQSRLITQFLLAILGSFIGFLISRLL